MSEETTFRYYGDVAAVTVVRGAEQARFKLNSVVRIVKDIDHDLLVTLYKTEIIGMTKKRMQTNLPIRLLQGILEKMPGKN